MSGVFKVADWYDRHPNSTPSGTTLTGVLVADGIPPTPAEAPADHHGKWVGQNELPVTVDRADPSNFRIEWDQVVKNDWRSEARQRATEAASRMATDQPPAGSFITYQSPAGAATGAFATDFNPTDFSPMVSDVLRAVGIDPTNLANAAQHGIHVETSFTSQPFTTQPFTTQPQRTESATGVVRAVLDVVGGPPLPPGMSQADLTLDVGRPDGTTYPVTTRIGFRSPERRAAIAVVGNELPVLVDPANPGRVVIDVARLNLP